MIQINQIKMKPGYSIEQLEEKLCKMLSLSKEQIDEYEIIKESIDARKKPEIYMMLSVLVTTKLEYSIKQRNKNKDILFVTKETFVFPKSGNKPLLKRPIIVGAGPSGLYCAYYLAKNGYRPIVLERGEDVIARSKSILHFWNTGELNPESNVQFGEGGAGTFSDGKLNTLMKDKNGRNKEILRLFVEMGAPKEILYKQKPHLGTDRLLVIVKKIREEIIANGGEVHFNSKVTDFHFENGLVTGVTVNESKLYDTSIVVLATGHSAHDSIYKLYESGLEMQAKSFAVGYRVSHTQQKIDESQYGSADNKHLPAADYKLTATSSSGRGVYTFCMCPGGYVVNASSEKEALAVNGMSYSGRDSDYANSAVIVAVNPEDFPKTTPEALAGIAFQKELEVTAYQIGNGNVPVQRFADFKLNIETKEALMDEPCIKGSYSLANVRAILPEYINEAFLEGMQDFDRKIKGFAADDTLIMGVESRTSSPVRITRNESFEANIKGVYPCGEGAGYAGGITSAAVDGLKIAEAIAIQFAPLS